jgi:Zn-dependent peptidase ImmA (M78 family)/transcriptional regulator with XRE-family HTH domain
MPITEADLAARLRETREVAGLTQDEVAARLQLPRSSIAQIELANRSVSSLELDELARLYGRSLDELLGESFDPAATLVAVFRAEAAAARQDDLLDTAALAIELARHLAELEQKLEITRARLQAPAYAVPAPRNKWEAVQQGSQAATEERRRLGLGDSPVGDVADLLESQGVRTALLELPDGISGLTLMDPRLAFFVVNNQRHPVLRRRFSWVHEYAHVLFDRDRRGTVSRETDRAALDEVRANAFAAGFLLPAAGVQSFLEGLGKGRGSRERWDVHDESDEAAPVAAEGRAEPRSQEIQLYDVVRLAHRFGVSRTAAIYRLKNLRLVSQPAIDRLLDQEATGQGLQIERTLRVPAWQPARDDSPTEADEATLRGGDFRGRFLSLAFEAYRREKISRGKLHELGRLVDVSAEELDELLDRLGLLDDPDLPAPED